MATTKEEAQDALFAEIKRQIENLGQSNAGNASYQSNALRDIALAYRYAAGGAQPGSLTVEK